MTEDTKNPAPMTPERARVEAQAKAQATKHIINRIKASKAKRAASRPKPRVKAD
jgi:hypothetical protein